MTWQEELGQLDEALADGRLSAEEYRQRRDQLMSKAASGKPSAEGNQAGSQPANTPQATGESAGKEAEQPAERSPFPPPFKWNQESSPETTQVIQPVKDGPPPGAGDSDRTQVVPHSGDTTQVVPGRGQGPVQGPPQRPTQQGQPGQHGHQGQPGQRPGGPPGGPVPPMNPWAPQPGGSTVPPWASGDPAEPLVGWGGYQPQGPEFEADVKPGKGKLFAVLGAAVLVLLLVGTVVYLTVFRSSDDPPPVGQDPTTTAAETTTSAPPETFGPLFVPEGRTSGPKTFSADELFNAKPLPAPDIVVLKQTGLSEASSVIVVDGTTTISIWSFTPGSSSQELHDQLLLDQERFGFVEAPDAAQGDVQVFNSRQESASRTVYVYRAHYVSGQNVIRVEAFDVDDNVARERFDDVLKRQLDHNPPT